MSRRRLAIAAAIRAHPDSQARKIVDRFRTDPASPVCDALLVRIIRENQPVVAQLRLVDEQVRNVLPVGVLPDLVRRRGLRRWPCDLAGRLAVHHEDAAAVCLPRRLLQHAAGARCVAELYLLDAMYECVDGRLVCIVRRRPLRTELPGEELAL